MHTESGDEMVGYNKVNYSSKYFYGTTTYFKIKLSLFSVRVFLKCLIQFPSFSDELNKYYLYLRRTKK